MILSRPITKPQYILGKYCGLALIILISTAVLGACSMLSVKLATMGAEAFVPHMFSWSVFLLGLIYLTLSLLLVLAIAFLCVSVTTHPFTAILLCLMTYFIGQNAETVLKVITRSKMFDQNPVLLKIIHTVHWVFPNLSAFDLKTTAAYGLAIDAGYLLWVALYGMAYLSICIVLSIAIFNRRELG
jgi:ABC-type transport system involved in multi-copper enzyme maturation permease subunit